MYIEFTVNITGIFPSYDYENVQIHLAAENMRVCTYYYMQVP